MGGGRQRAQGVLLWMLGMWLGIWPASSPAQIRPKPKGDGCAGIATLTVSSHPENRKRKKLGVGEQVLLTAIKADGEVEWEITDGPGRLNRTDGAVVTFTAHDVESTSTITAHYNGTSCSVTFEVVPPSGIELSLFMEDDLPVGTAGAGMWLTGVLQPTDVSFGLSFKK